MKKILKITALVILIIIAFVYAIDSLWYIMARLYFNTTHLLSLIAVFVGSSGALVWSITHLRRGKNV